MLNQEKGQALTEFALVIPLILLLSCGVLDFGRVLYSYLQLNLTAQEAVRLAGLGHSDADITLYAQQHEQLGPAASLTVTITPNDLTRKAGDNVTVSLKYTLSYLTPVVANLFPAPVVSTNTTIRVE